MSRHGSWAVLDQSASSLATLVLSVTIFRCSTSSEQVEFSLVLILNSIVITLGRSVGAEVTAVENRGSDSGRALTRSIETARLSLLTMVVLSVVLAVGFHLSTQVGILALLGSLLALSADTARTRHIAVREPQRAAWQSIRMLAPILAGCSAALALNDPSVAIFGWIIGGLISAPRQLLNCLQPGRVRPRRYTFLWESAASTTASQVSVIVAASLIEPQVAAVVRAGMTVFGPYYALLQAVTLSLVPHLRVYQVRRSIHPVAMGASISVALATILAGWLVIVISFQEQVEYLMGDGWRLVNPIIAPLAVSIGGAVLTTSTLVACRVCELNGRSLLLRISSAFLQVSSVLLAVVLGDIGGYFWCNASANAIAGVLGIALLLVNRDRSHGRNVRKLVDLRWQPNSHET